MNKFYTCKNDRTFKEVFLNPNNSDLLKALLEVILKIKIDKLEIKKTELLSGNVNIRDKRVDALVYTSNKKIEIGKSTHLHFIPPYLRFLIVSLASLFFSIG